MLFLHNRMTNSRGRRENQQRPPTQTITLNVIIGELLRPERGRRRRRQMRKHGLRPKSRHINTEGRVNRQLSEEFHQQGGRRWSRKRRLSLSCSHQRPGVQLKMQAAPNSHRKICQVFLQLSVSASNTSSKRERPVLGSKKESGPHSVHENIDGMQFLLQSI